MDLRPYQQQALAELRKRWRDRPLLQIPTGGGKTVVAAALVEGALGKGKRVLIVAHTRQIVAQTARRFRAAGLPASVEMAEQRAASTCIVGSIQTIAARGAPAHDVLIVDEAHHATAATYRELVTRAPVVVGLTATPYRLDGRGLGEVGFGCIITPITARALVEQGFLMEPIVYAPSVPDRSALKRSGADWTAASAADSMRALTGNIVEHWKDLARGDSRTVAFCATVEHAHTLAARFLEAGVNAQAISGQSSNDERDRALAALAAGTLSIVCQCQLLGEGWDLPSLDCAILARPTMSLSVHRQQIGRVLRSSPNKPTPLVLDHAGNHERHGSALDEVECSLDGKAKPTPSTKHKRCPECFVMMPAFLPTCPECGHHFASSEGEGRAPLTENDGKLTRWEPEAERDFYVRAVQDAWNGGRKLGYARFRFKEKFGRWPKLYDVERAHYPCTDHRWEQREHRAFPVCGRCLRQRTPDQIQRGT